VSWDQVLRSRQQQWRRRSRGWGWGWQQQQQWRRRRKQQQQRNQQRVEWCRPGAPGAWLRRHTSDEYSDKMFGLDIKPLSPALELQPCSLPVPFAVPVPVTGRAPARPPPADRPTAGLQFLSVLNTWPQKSQKLDYYCHKSCRADAGHLRISLYKLYCPIELSELQLYLTSFIWCR
jgi:hypothetical protein